MIKSTPKPEAAVIPDVVKIISFGGNLYTATGRPLYRYFPLAEMSRLGHPVPWAVNWDAYITAWIHTYAPFPRTTSDTPVVSKGGLDYQDRTGAGPGRTYQQATYRGWPLYTCDLDTADFAMPPQGTVPGLFEMVSVCEPPVIWNSEQPPRVETEPPGEGWPYVLSGP